VVSNPPAKQDPIPAALRVAALLTALEAVALVVAALVLIYLIVFHTSTRLWAALAVLAFVLGGAVLLWFCARGLRRARPASRTPVVMVQILALPGSYSLGFQAGKYLIAVPIMVVVVAILVLLFTPAARSALDRNWS
jgi:hypothetical protein